ncbi:unnamed protein product [Musa acuminata subsp. malaccensis]|uniref:(wild Malaysian banana) hypothetical protein n=1 Tax=Musa acuminata subsp. malaccensis TaxID=214687 RepID=A0A804HZY5_MUSAM|nr:unnamed protein product [Musa acuminata subsp. malaccensis]
MHRSRAAQLGDSKSGERQIHSLLLPLFHWLDLAAKTSFLSAYC